MPKFRVIVTQTTALEVEIDAAEMTEAWQAEFRRYFYDYDTLQQHAEHLGRIVACDLTSEGDFVEGYGFIKVGHYSGSRASYSLVAERSPAAPHMNISVQMMDEDVEVEAEEVPAVRVPAAIVNEGVQGNKGV